MARVSAKTRAEAEQTIWRKSVEGDPIYHVIAWDMSGALVAATRVREMLVTAGLDDIRLPTISERSALLRALREMQEDRFLRQIWNDASEQAWALFRQGETEERDGKATRRAQFHQEETVAYLKRLDDPHGERVVYSSMGARIAIEPKLREYLAGYTTRDIVEHVLNYVVQRLGGIKMRGQGGAYLVPPTGGDTVARLRTFVEMFARETSTDSHLTDLELADSGRTREDVRWHSHKALVDQLRGMRAELKDMLRADRAGKVTSETIGAYLAKVDQAGQVAALYRDVAQLGLREISEALAALRTAFDAVRTGLSPEEFDATLASVDAAIQGADGTRPHQATPGEAGADPFGGTLANATMAQSSPQPTAALAPSPASDDPFAGVAFE